MADAGLLAGTVVSALLEAGVRDVVLAPGSRSAPLAYALWAAERAGSLRLLVRVDERVAPSRPTLAEVRPLVERELVAERRRTQLQALYDRLLQKYTVKIEMPAPEKAAPTPASGGSVR